MKTFKANHVRDFDYGRRRRRDTVHATHTRDYSCEGVFRDSEQG